MVALNKGWLAILLVVIVAGTLAESQAVEQAKKSDAVVKVSAKADELGADGKQNVTLTLEIEKPYHLYANPTPPDFPGLPVTVTIESKTKLQAVKVDYPEGKVVKDALVGDHKIYEDKVTIKATVQRAKGDKEPLDVSVKVQACTDKSCLLPGIVKLTVK